MSGVASAGALPNAKAGAKADKIADRTWQMLHAPLLPRCCAWPRPT